MMQRRGPMMEHWRKVSEMANATETDLVKAFEDRVLSPDQWANMVRVCQACTWVGGCEEWLDAHEGAFRAPHQCPNRARFAVLKASQTAEGA